MIEPNAENITWFTVRARQCCLSRWSAKAYQPIRTPISTVLPFVRSPRFERRIFVGLTGYATGGHDGATIADFLRDLQLKRWPSRFARPFTTPIHRSARISSRWRHDEQQSVMPVWGLPNVAPADADAAVNLLNYQLTQQTARKLRRLPPSSHVRHRNRWSAHESLVK